MDGIPPSPRGIPQIEVTFDIDANGILQVSAKDKATGKSQEIRIEASSGLTDDEIQKMKDEAEANADADKKAKEEIEKMNSADALVFQTEKQLKEYGDKIPAEKKAPIETALGKLKEAHKNKDLPGIETSMEELNTAWQAASQEMYAATNQQGAWQSCWTGTSGRRSGKCSSASDEVTDVDFEEVKDDK